jgi:hypothetical protein
MRAETRIILLATGGITFLCAVPSAAQSVSPAGTLTAQRITETPPIRALCLPGSGDSKAYSDSMIALVKLANDSQISTIGFVFSDNWAAGPDPKDPGTGASWEVCVESGALSGKDVKPLILRNLKPRAAAYGTCESVPEGLQSCFAGLEEFAKGNKVVPAAPPRYRIRTPVRLATNIQVYDVWIPVVNEPATIPANVQSEHPK